MNFDYIFWDLDGTLYDSNNISNPVVSYPGLRKLMRGIDKGRQGIITNNPFPHGMLDNFKMTKYINPELIFEPITQAEYAYDNKLSVIERIAQTGNRALDTDNLSAKIEKPDPYMCKRATEVARANPEKCLLIGDSYEDVLAGQLSGMKTLYLKGSEDDKFNIYNLKLSPDYRVCAGDIKSISNIIFG